jgi:hypothetical protein
MYYEEIFREYFYRDCHGMYPASVLALGNNTVSGYQIM